MIKPFHSVQNLKLRLFCFSLSYGAHELQWSWRWIWIWCRLWFRRWMGFRRNAIECPGYWSRWRMWGWFRPRMGLWLCLWKQVHIISGHFPGSRVQPKGS